MSYLLIDPSYPNPFVNGGSAGLATDEHRAVRSEPCVSHTRFNTALEWNGNSRSRLTIAVTYSGSRGIDLFRSQDINAPLGPDYLTVPNPALGFVRQIESAGRQAGNSLDITVRGALTHRLTGLDPIHVEPH